MSTISPSPTDAPEPAPTHGQALRTLFLSIAGRLTLALIAAVAAMAAFIRIAHDVTEGKTLRADRAILNFFHAHQTPVFHAAMTGISWLAGPKFQTGVVVAGVFGFAIARRFWPDGFALLVAGVGGLGVIVGLKQLFHRPRPSEVFAHLGYSFPSGHSFFALTVYGMFAYWLARDASPRRRRLIWSVAAVAILFVGFSRVALGEHFPSDVMAGFAIGLPWLWGCLAVPSALHQDGRDITPEEHHVRVTAKLRQVVSAAASVTGQGNK